MGGRVQELGLAELTSGVWNTSQGVGSVPDDYHWTVGGDGPWSRLLSPGGLVGFSTSLCVPELRIGYYYNVTMVGHEDGTEPAMTGSQLHDTSFAAIRDQLVTGPGAVSSVVGAHVSPSADGLTFLSDLGRPDQLGPRALDFPHIPQFADKTATGYFNPKPVPLLGTDQTMLINSDAKTEETLAPSVHAAHEAVFQSILQTGNVAQAVQVVFATMTQIA